VGKTTCAALFALDGATARRTLLVTTDPASSLSAALGIDVGSAPVSVRGAKNLVSKAMVAAATVRSLAGAARCCRDDRGPRRTGRRGLSRGCSKLSLPGIDEVIG
jgi:anion-transporting  ArsA/GET3 family ATPase